MNRMYGKLARVNISKNKLLYIPYIVSGIIVVAFIYMMGFMSNNPGMDDLYGSDMLIVVMRFGQIIIGIFSYIFLFYTNSFLVKRRKKEFGVYNMLGMEKRHICRVLTVESFIVAGISIVGGILMGIAFSKLMMMLLLHMVNVETSFAFSISWQSIVLTLVVFLVLYSLILLFNIRQIYKANTIELIRGGSVGEKEPKSKLFLAISGFALLVAGYYISITVKDPIAAITLFFVAVLLVIVGTYLTFTAGSIFVLKLLRKNKKFYYNKRRMTAVSGMLYRMKQNAVGLANICILSTMVLVTISTTVSLYAGVEDTLNNMYPCEQEVICQYLGENAQYAGRNEELVALLLDEAKKHNLEPSEVLSSSGFSIFGRMENGTLTLSGETMVEAQDSYLIQFCTKEDFETVYSDFEGTVPELKPGQILVTTSKGKNLGEQLNLCGLPYEVAEYAVYRAEEMDIVENYLDDSAIIVVSDETELKKLYAASVSIGNEKRYDVTYDMNLQGEEEDKVAFEIDLERNMASLQDGGSLSASDRINYMNKAEGRTDYYLSYGGLLFLGIACGGLFLMITVLIIFYKQISEGYDDRARYEVMEKVGMSSKEVKDTINAQVRMVFFLPLLVSFCHLAGAFPMIRLMMSVLVMGEVKVFIISLIITGLVFAAIYYAIFKVTSKVYYGIVR